MRNRFYMVTFDIINSKGREADYRSAENALKFRFGNENYWKPLKQCAIVRTDGDASAIRDMLRQSLGANCNILVLRIRGGFAFRIRDRAKRLDAEACLSQL